MPPKALWIDSGDAIVEYQFRRTNEGARFVIERDSLRTIGPREGAPR